MGKRRGRSLGAVTFASLALLGSAASCSSSAPTDPPDFGGGAGKGSGATSNAGVANMGTSGGMHGGTSGAGGTGGSTGGSSTGGTGGTSSTTGGTGTGGVGTGGSLATGGSAGAAQGGGSGTGSSAGGMSFGGKSFGGMSGGMNIGGKSGAGGNSAGHGNGGMSSGGMSSGGSGGFGNNGGVAPPPDISGGSNGWASRYWDCCKPACGWTGNTGGRNPIKSCDKSNNTLSDNNATNACQGGGTAYMCWQDAPWAVGDKLSYGFVAASGSNYNCGECFHIQFDGGTHNGGMQSASASLKGKHMIVQVINNGGVQNDQFDILIPGGGVGALNACTSNGAQLGSGTDLGAQYGGLLTECNGDVNCTQQKCNSVFAGKQDLLDGCNWFLGWFAGADNPSFTYTKIACPSAITNQSGLSDPG